MEPGESVMFVSVMNREPVRAALMFVYISESPALQGVMLMSLKSTHVGALVFRDSITKVMSTLHGQ